MSTKNQRFFVTGTDTDCGKTLVSCALLRAAADLGMSTAAMKPVAAGAEQTPDGLRNDDALRLQAASTQQRDYEQVNPLCLPDPLSPHLAARNAGRSLRADRLVGFCRGFLLEPADFMLIEGAGGWRVPINEREYLSDVARELKLPVILVVGMRLGCLNHALLTAEAIYRDGLQLAGWVANTRDAAMLEREANLQTLVEALPAPLLADMPALADPDDLDQAARHVNLNAISL